LSGRGLCDELITRPEESYRLCCVVVCDLETSRIGAPYIYGIISLRVNYLTVILLTWRKWWAPNTASKQQIRFNSAFKGLIKLSVLEFRMGSIRTNFKSRTFLYLCHTFFLCNIKSFINILSNWHYTSYWSVLNVIF